MEGKLLDLAQFAIPAFCFGYPFVMAWYWMAGGARAAPPAPGTATATLILAADLDRRALL
jgi:hypothetical protein